MIGQLRRFLYRVIVESDTPKGKVFDLVLMGFILASVIVVMLDSMAPLSSRYARQFVQLEWGFTIVFSIEYLLRLWVVKRPSDYACSFFGIIDLLAILPSYISLFFPGGQYLLVIRLLRALRIFRILKLVQFVAESRALLESLRSSFRKVLIFIFSVVILVIILGSIMYSIEGGGKGFTSIPRSIYWAIVTLTTVGYGDISPSTNLGQFVASVIMLMGYGIIAVPAGIVTSELNQQQRAERLSCPDCGKGGHDRDARYCQFCRAPLGAAS